MRFSQTQRVLKVQNITSNVSRNRAIDRRVILNTPTPTPTNTPTSTVTPTPTPTNTATPTNTPTLSLPPTNTPTISLTPTNTPTPTPTPTSTGSPAGSITSTLNGNDPSAVSLGGTIVSIENVSQKINATFADPNMSVYFYNNWNTTDVLFASTVVQVGSNVVANISYTTDRIGHTFGFSLNGSVPQYYGVLTNGGTVVF